MTQPSQPQPGGTLLWTDERISRRAQEWQMLLLGHANFEPVGWIEGAMIELRDEYENAIAERDEKITELERKLSNCSEYADKVRQQNIELAEQYYRLRAGLSDKDGNE